MKILIKWSQLKVNKVLTNTDMGMEHSDVFTKVCLTHRSTVTDMY
jgi:hypothetical protein